MNRVKNIIKSAKSYAHEIGLGKCGWVFVLADSAISKLCYGFNQEDYFVISNGYAMSAYEKKRYFSVRKSMWIQKNLNHPDYIHFIENKVEALKLFNDLVQRDWLYVQESSLEDFKDFVKRTPAFIAKPIRSFGGTGIEKHIVNETSEEDLSVLYKHLKSEDMLVEECIKAHDDINLGSVALSTFRIFTMIDRKGDVHVLKAKYRVGTGCAITDTADGCVAYPISIKYGVIEGPGINEVLNSKLYYYHPGCNKMVVGMKIPMWDQVIEVVIKAAKKIPQVRYIGWDIAITNKSVEIIEGNHDAYHGTFEIMGSERLWWPKIKSLI